MIAVVRVCVGIAAKPDPAAQREIVERELARVQLVLERDHPAERGSGRGDPRGDFVIGPTALLRGWPCGSIMRLGSLRRRGETLNQDRES